ncbi:MAG: hypothetical protein H5U28_10670 [Burkholderiaceae bacterium]|nr:hypothetical protein [Burkholderiaceae bacterium]
MKIDKIEITIAARGCIGYDDVRDAETEAYLDAYTEAVVDAVAEKYPDAKVEGELDWSAPASSVTVESQEYDAIEVDGIRKTQRGTSTIDDLNHAVEATKEMDEIEESVRSIWQRLWDNPEIWLNGDNA